jgi:hypothetical protein
VASFVPAAVFDMSQLLLICVLVIAAQQSARSAQPVPEPPLEPLVPLVPPLVPPAHAGALHDDAHVDEPWRHVEHSEVGLGQLL